MKQKKSIKKHPPVKKPVRDKAGHFVKAKRKYNRRRRKVVEQAGISPDIGTSLKRLVEGIKAMKESQKKALLAISAAALALGAAATALAESAGESEPAPKEPAKAETPKTEKPPKAETPKTEKPPKVEPAKVEPAKVEPAKVEPATDDLFKQAIEAAKEYASVYGREGVVGVMKKFLPDGAKTMQDIPADKLPAFIAELKG